MIKKTSNEILDNVQYILKKYDIYHSTIQIQYV